MSKYVVTDGVKYLRQNHSGEYYLESVSNATAWNTFKQALNALNNGVPKRIRNSFFVEKANKSANNKETNLQKLIEADTSDFNRWLSSIGNFKRFVNTIEDEKNSLASELSNIDKEICDLNHYIEFGKLNAYQGWTAYEMLKLSLIQRRKIKNALYIISEIQERRYGTSESESAKTAITKLNNRIYTPRKLDFLFENCSTMKC